MIKREEYFVVQLLNDFKSVIEKLKAINIEDPLDYLKEVVNKLQTKEDSQYVFGDCDQMRNLLEKVNTIKSFFKDEKHKNLKSINSYTTSLKIPSATELIELSLKKRIVEEKIISIDINEIILEDGIYNIILNDFTNLTELYSDFYIAKHEEINSLRGHFCEHLLTSSKFNLLSQLSSIDQIRQTLLNPPTKIKSDIQLIRNQKCIITKEDLSEKLEKSPVCLNCRMKFEEFYDNTVIIFLDSSKLKIKENINKSLLSALKNINDKKDKIKEILVKEKYYNIDNLLAFFDIIFEVFIEITDENERIVELDSKVDNLYNLFSDNVLEVIREAFSEEPVVIVINLVEEIVKIMESKIYNAEELITEFNEKIELVKENNKKKEFEKMGLGTDDDKPIIHFKFRKI